MILIAKFKEISGPFILGKLAQNLKRTSSKVKTHLYVSDPEDCLIFNYEFTAQVEKHLVTGTVWELQFTDEGRLDFRRLPGPVFDPPRKERG